MGAPSDPSTDLWNLGAVVLEVFRAVCMFDGRGPPDGNYRVEYHVHEVVDFFGLFPQSLLQQGNPELVRKYFDNNGRIKSLPPLNQTEFESEAFLGKLDDETKTKLC